MGSLGPLSEPPQHTAARLRGCAGALKHYPDPKPTLLPWIVAALVGPSPPITPRVLPLRIPTSSYRTLSRSGQLSAFTT